MSGSIFPGRLDPMSKEEEDKILTQQKQEQVDDYLKRAVARGDRIMHLPVVIDRSWVHKILTDEDCTRTVTLHVCPPEGENGAMLTQSGMREVTVFTDDGHGNGLPILTILVD